MFSTPMPYLKDSVATLTLPSDPHARLVASEEMWWDPDYMESMDIAYHHWCHPKYADQKKRFEERLKNGNC